MRLGIDFGGTHIKFGIFAEDGREIAFRQIRLAELNTDDNLLENMISAIADFIGKRTISKGGFAVKGLVDPKTGIWHSDIGEYQYFADRNLRHIFSNELGFPFVVDNDARAYAWGEWLFGAGQDSNPMVCMTLGTGIGSALVIDGKPYEGADPVSGLLGGHISIDRNGPVCSCGNRGCLELYCSATALAGQILNLHSDFSESDSDILVRFFDEIRNGNKNYQKTLQSFIDNLAIGIVNIIHAYGPQTVVIGGGVMNSADLILPELTEKVHSMAWTFPKNSVKIKASKLGNRGAAIGAAFHPYHNR